MSTISGVSSSSDAWASMKAQRSQMQAKMFAKVDTDRSGGVDKTELKSMLDEVAKKTGVTNSSSTDELFGKMDANSDGNLSSDELGKGMKDILPPPSTLEFAQNRAQEAGGATPPPPPGGTGGADSSSASNTTYDPLDTNEDGTVSIKERLAGSTSTDAVQTLLKAIDTDGDSKISSSESDNFIQRLSSQLDAMTQSTQSTNNSEGGQLNKDDINLAELVTKAYEQIASGLQQQTTGATLSAVA